MQCETTWLATQFRPARLDVREALHARLGTRLMDGSRCLSDWRDQAGGVSGYTADPVDVQGAESLRVVFDLVTACIGIHRHSSRRIQIKRPV